MEPYQTTSDTKDERTAIEDQTAENHGKECKEKNDTVPAGKTETTVQKIQISHLNFAIRMERKF